MKKVGMMLALVLLLTGCGTAETFETVADEMVQSVMAEPAQVHVTLPEEAVLPAMEVEGGSLYLCKDYDIAIQTLESGDLDATIRSVSGYSREDLTVMETSQGENVCYEFVWTAVGDDGEQVCRGMILDDGSYHYVLTAMADAEVAAEYREIWNGIFDSFYLS